MEHKIIKTENYLLVVSDEEIKVGDFVFATNGSDIFARCEIVPLPLPWKKVLAHKPLNGAPYLDGVDELPEFEDEVIGLGTEHFWTSQKPNTSAYSFIEGYNKAKETYKYTEEDLFRMFLFGHSLSEAIKRGVIEDKPMGEIFNDRIQSLNQPKLPIAFESERITTPTQIFAANCGRGDCSVEIWENIIKNIKNGLNTKS